MSKLRDKTLALAAVFQVTSLVRDIATQGALDRHDLEVCLRSTLDLDPQSVDAIYGSPANLRTGLHSLIEQLGNARHKRNLDIARYTISLLHLERKLAKHQDMLSTIREGILRARQQIRHFPVTHDNVIANLADIYANTISQLTPRIMVTGEAHFLSDSENANQIRALLLSGIRSAVLWSQRGGSRWQILFQRKMYLNEAQRLLEEEMSTHLH